MNEVYLRLVGSESNFNDRVHFFAVAARPLRRILVDHARANNRQKRGAGAAVLSLDEALDVGPGGTGSIVYQDRTHLQGALAMALAPNGDLLVTNSGVINGDPNQLSKSVEFTTSGPSLRSSR